MKNVFTLILMLWAGQANSQNIKGKITDASSLSGIGYASVYYKKAEVRTYSDSIGNFNIQKILGDTLVFSALGFEMYLISIKDETEDLNIVLTPLRQEIDKVEITGKLRARGNRNKAVVLGNTSKKSLVHVTGKLGRSTAFLIKSTADANSQVQTIQYALNQVKHLVSSDAIVRAQLYTVNPYTGKPDKDLLLGSAPLKVRNTDKQLIVHLAHLNIVFPTEGLYVGLEWMGDLEPHGSTFTSPWYSNSRTEKPATVYFKFPGKDWQLKGEVTKQSKATKKGRNTPSLSYFEAPNFTITVK